MNPEPEHEKAKTTAELKPLHTKEAIRERLASGPKYNYLKDFVYGAIDGAVTTFADGVSLVACYHPSQQNTFTGKLTRAMLRDVFRKSRALLDRPDQPPLADRVARAGSRGSR